MSELDELREIRALLTELRDLERESLELQRDQAARVQASVRTQEEAVARQRSALRVALVLTVVLVAMIVPLLAWLWTKL
jgi:hypothetical protein